MESDGMRKSILGLLMICMVSICLVGCFEKDSKDKTKEGTKKETKVKEILEKKETINFVILKFKEQVTSEKEENDNNS